MLVILSSIVPTIYEFRSWNGTRPETRFRLSPKRTSPFKLAATSVQLTAGSWGVRISLSNVGYTTFGGGVRVLATHYIRQFPLHFPSRTSPCANRFRTSSMPFCRSLYEYFASFAWTLKMEPDYFL